METQLYHALHKGATVQPRSNAGVLMLEDADRVDFLHRMTTNDIARLQPGHSTVTVLTNPTARVLYAFTVMAFPNKLYCLPMVGQTDTLRKHLRSQIFFMDKVKVTNLSSDVTRIRIMGPEAVSLAQKVLLAQELPTTDLSESPEGAFFQKSGSQGVTYILKQNQFDVPGVEVMVPNAESESLIQSLCQEGAVLLTDEDAYNARRIEVGQPAVGHELRDEYNPLEVGLQWTCAENKGCYTGQEIIARQITYDKITKTLVGLRASSPMVEGTDVMVDGRKAGQVTSAAYSPLLEAHVGLAVLKRPQNQPGVHVHLADTDAEVMSLPLSLKETTAESV